MKNDVDGKASFGREEANAMPYPTPASGQPLHRKLVHGKTVCPGAKDVCKRILSIPVNPSVDEDDIAYILNVLKEVG